MQTLTPQKTTEWEQRVPPGAPLVFCGAGDLCQQVLDHFDGGIYDHPTMIVVDNDPDKRGLKIYPNADRHKGYFVRPVETEILQRRYNHWFYVILIHLGAEDMRQQLIDLGVEPHRIIHWWTLWQHHDGLKLPAWADVPPHPKDWLDAWSDEDSRIVIRNAYDFFSTYSDRTAVYQPVPAYSLPENIYFDETVYRRLPDERFLDCGAFDGDTLHAFHKAYQGRHGSMLAVEASPENYAKLLAKGFSYSFTCTCGINLINAALVRSQIQDMVRFTGHGVSAKIADNITDDGPAVLATTIDKLCTNFSPTLIKLDVEGGELDALRGGAKTIKRDRPVIACCLYHHPRDLWEIPAFLASICPDYKFAARCYDNGHPGFEVVMYAVPAERWAIADERWGIDA